MWAIIDTSVYIDHWERGLYADALEKVSKAFIVRHSAVVLSELRRGARSREAQRTISRLQRLARNVWEPSATDWWEAGHLIRTIGDTQDWDRNKRRDFQNDALIALTARGHGSTIITSNRQDFQLLAGSLKVSVLFV